MTTASITIATGDSNIVVPTEPKVIIQRFLTLRDWKGDLGSIDATFDLSDLDPRAQSIAINVLLGLRQGLSLGDIVRPRPVHPAGSLTHCQDGELGLSNTGDEPTQQHQPWWRRWAQRLTR